MSVLIKGMKMPENCNECELYSSMYSSGCDIASLGIPSRYDYDTKVRPDWCPLVEVPEPHGRLIDADKLFRDIEWDDIENAPTVIEAEKRRASDGRT